MTHHFLYTASKTCSTEFQLNYADLLLFNYFYFPVFRGDGLNVSGCKTDDIVLNSKAVARHILLSKRGHYES